MRIEGRRLELNAARGAQRLAMLLGFGGPGPGGKVAALKSALADSAEEWKRDATLG